MDIETLDTGDIVLFYDSKSIISRLIDYFGGSDYSHVGMIVKNPSWIAQPGIYLIQSGREPIPDVETHNIRMDVSMFLFSDVVQSYEGIVHVRRLSKPYNIDMKRMAEIHASVHAMPYNTNPIDWLCVLMNVTGGREVQTRFWCSALVAFIYVQLKLLPADYPFTYAKPGAFASDLTLSAGYALRAIEVIK